MHLASGCRMAGDVNSAIKEIESAITIFEREMKPEKALDALLLGAQNAWHARRTEEMGRWVEKGLQSARDIQSPEALRQFLSMAATLANMRGEYQRANEYLQEAEKLEPGTSTASAGEEIPEGGRLMVALATPVPARVPAQMEFVEEWEVFANVFEPLLTTDHQGNLVPGLCEEWEARDEGRAFLLKLRQNTAFADGHLLVAEDVRRAFERAIKQSGTDLPAVFSSIRGVGTFVDGGTDHVEGLVVHGEHELEVQLDQALPIYPALLTDGRAGITRATNGNENDAVSLVGTGPFKIISHEDDRIVLERNANYWKGQPPKLDAVEFRLRMDTSAIASGLRAEELDLAGDLLPQDLEEILREPRFRAGLVEVPVKGTYFILFNTRTGSLTKDAEVRRALAGVVRSHDLVWQTLGRFAQPASRMRRNRCSLKRGSLVPSS
jgi:ABC-type transport system substrate-binding protein